MLGVSRTMAENDKKNREEKLTDREMFVRKAINENYGIWMILGGMYIGKWWILPIEIALTCWHLPNVAIAIYKCIDDIVVVAESLHFQVLLFMSFFMSVVYLAERERIDNIYEAIGRGYYNYENTLDPETQRRVEAIKQESAKRLAVCGYIIYAGIFAASVCVLIIRPLLQFYVPALVTLGKLPPGVNGSKDSFIYYFWEEHFEGFYWLTLIGYFTQDLYTIINAFIIIGYSTSVVTIVESIYVQLEILNISLLRLRQRAIHVTGLNPKQKDVYELPEYVMALDTCLKHSIRQHQVTLKIFGDFKQINYLVLLWLSLGVTFLLCFSVTLFKSDASLISKGTFAAFLFCETGCTLLVCWYGELLTSASSDPPLMLYNVEWYKCSRLIAVYHGMLVQRCAKPMEISVGGFAVLSRNMFLDILKTAFSYANIMQANSNRT